MSGLGHRLVTRHRDSQKKCLIVFLLNAMALQIGERRVWDGAEHVILSRRGVVNSQAFAFCLLRWKYCQ